MTGCAGLQKLAADSQRVGEDHGLELAARVREHGERELVALLRAALARRDDDTGKPAGRGAACASVFELAVAADAELGQHALVLIERMARKEEADGIEFLLQSRSIGVQAVGRAQDEVRRALPPPPNRSVVPCASSARSPLRACHDLSTLP